MEITDTLEDFLLRPTPETRRAVRDMVLTDPTFDARIALRELLGADPSPRIVVGTIGARMPGLLLSPQAHGLLARAHQALGEETDASRERKLSILSLREIADSGTGTVAADGNAEDLLPILVGIPPCAASGESGRSAIARGLRLTSSAPSSTRM